MVLKFSFIIKNEFKLFNIPIDSRKTIYFILFSEKFFLLQLTNYEILNRFDVFIMWFLDKWWFHHRTFAISNSFIYLSNSLFPYVTIFILFLFSLLGSYLFKLKSFKIFDIFLHLFWEKKQNKALHTKTDEAESDSCFHWSQQNKSKKTRQPNCPNTFSFFSSIKRNQYIYFWFVHDEEN